MTYFEGFVVPVPEANKEAYSKHASGMFPMLQEFGVARLAEAWGDDVPDGKVTDFRRAVKAEDGENVVFSWFEYPSKEARNAANEKMMSDPRMEEMGADMPFDGKRMIMGGFEAIVEEGERGSGSYTDGFVVPVPNDNREAYRTMAAKMAGTFRESGALRVVEAWGDDVPDGKTTDFRRAVKAEEGENVVFSFVEWPDKATRDAAWKAMMEDPNMQPGSAMPFDGKRMFWGGFTPIVDTLETQDA
ncbi:MAG: DUF1428 domain-containing protein [Sphingomonas sp.]|nr:DUF1428 domain-containing protein [Sphingomonas sp.]